MLQIRNTNDLLYNSWCGIPPTETLAALIKIIKPISLIDMPFTHACKSPLTLPGHRSFRIKTNLVIVTIMYM